MEVDENMEVLADSSGDIWVPDAGRADSGTFRTSATLCRLRVKGLTSLDTFTLDDNQAAYVQSMGLNPYNETNRTSGYSPTGGVIDLYSPNGEVSYRWVFSNTFPL